MSAKLDRLKQQNAQNGSQPPLDRPETVEVLTSILDAVEAQNTRIAAVAEQQEKLTVFVKTMDGDLPERVARETSISQPSASTSQPIASVESRLSEIESTLGEFAKSLDGKRLQSATQNLIAETQKNHAATVSATEKLQAQAEENQKLVSRVGGAVQRMEKRTDERVQKAVEQAAGRVSAVMTANLDTSNERAKRVLEVAGRIENRLGWVAAGRMALALIPIAVISLMLLALIVPVGQVLGVGPIFGWAWSVVWDNSLFWVWRVLMALATLGALAGFACLVIRLAVPVTVWFDTRVRTWGQ